MSSLLKITLFLILLLPFHQVFAHEGHGIIPDGVLHYLFTPEHAFMLVFLLILSIYLYHRKYRSNA